MAERAICGDVDVLRLAVGHELILRQERVCLDLVHHLQANYISDHYTFEESAKSNVRVRRLLRR